MSKSKSCTCEPIMYGAVLRDPRCPVHGDEAKKRKEATRDQ